MSGAKRKIGTGVDTNVWSVPWLPSQENGFLVTTMLSQLRDVTVKRLMDIEARKWNFNILCDIYDNRDIELIKCIPIPK